MSNFVRYKDQYINLDYVAKIELRRGETNYIEVISANNVENILLQIEVKDINKAENAFYRLRSILKAENFVC